MFCEDQNKKEDIMTDEASCSETSQSDNQEHEAYQEQVSEWREKYLHLNADFQNYKRRQDKERGLWMHGAQAQVFKDLLTILGDFDRALAQPVHKDSDQASENWRVGFEMIRASFYKMLAKFEVTEIMQCTDFDPEIHEAIALVPSADHASGSIVDVVEKGFMFKGQVLRPAKVTVAQ